jgi:hypothetical protein
VGLEVGQRRLGALEAGADGEMIVEGVLEVRVVDRVGLYP